MKVSVITVTYNSSATLKDTIESVLKQSYSDIEHVIVDGASKDNTVNIIKSYPTITNWLSEPDSGLYDAINKGILRAKGEIIGILNSDDFFPDEFVISRIVETIKKKKIEGVYGDIAFVHPENLKKIVRYYSAKNFSPIKFSRGFMPPHPSFYVKKSCYDKFGLYEKDYKIAADYELVMRFIYKNRIRIEYLPMLFVYMRTGGVSNQTWYSRYLLNKEIIKACKENGVNTNMFKLSLKYFTKIFEFVRPASKIG